MIAPADNHLEAALRASLARGSEPPPSDEERAVSAARNACPRLRGRFEASPPTRQARVVAPHGRSILVRYFTPAGAEAAREWLFRADATPNLVELV